MISAYRDKKWLEANKEKEQGEYDEVLFENEYGLIRYGFFQKFAGEVDGTKYYDIASYRGAEGPYIEKVVDNNIEKLLDSFMVFWKDYCKNNNIIAEFAKLDPWDENADILREKLEAEYYGNYYCNNLTYDFYQNDYNRNAKRGIRKAEAAGVSACFDFEGKSIPRFVELYKNTENKFNTSNYYRMSEEDIKRYFEIYGEDAFLVNAVKEEKIITSVLVIMGEDIAHYYLLGSDPEYAKLQSNCLLTYKTALYCQSKGRKLFDMGGGIPGGGIERFKRNFIGESGVWEYFAIKKIHNKAIYDRLVELKGNIKNDKFFPRYRG